MSRLVEAARELGLEVDVALSGSWITLEGERGRAYVAETPGRNTFLTWCDDPADRTVEQFDDAVAAINAAVRRADSAAMAEVTYGAQAPRGDDSGRTGYHRR